MRYFSGKRYSWGIRAVFMTFLAVTPLCFCGSGYAEQAYDFGDIAQPFLSLPFNGVSVEVAGTDVEVRHIYHIAQPFDEVVEAFLQRIKRGEAFDGFEIMGFTKQQDGSYMLYLAKRNEHHGASLVPTGSGCDLIVNGMASSFLSGAFDIAVYGYVMPDGSEISIDKFDEE